MTVSEIKMLPRAEFQAFLITTMRLLLQVRQRFPNTCYMQARTPRGEVVTPGKAEFREKSCQLLRDILVMYQQGDLRASYLKHILKPLRPSSCPFGQEEKQGQFAGT